MLVVDRGKGNAHKLPTLKPMDHGGVNSHCLVREQVRPVLQIIMLSLLLILQKESRQSPHILLANRLIHGRPSTDPFSIIVSRVGPPVRLKLHIPQNHVLNGLRHAMDFPRNITFPTSPGLAQMLQNGTGLVGLDFFRHGVGDVFHYSCSQFQIEMRLGSLLGDGLGDLLGVPALELSG